MTKSELRKIYLQKRLSLDDKTYSSFCSQLCDRLFANFNFAFIKTIHTYLPIEKNYEPNTWLIIDKILKEFPEISISLPRVQDDHLVNFNFEGKHKLEINKWGIPEPKKGKPTPNDSIDMVIVPLLTFDKKGHRVGYGKGYYDRFLSTCRVDCKKIGISFFDPVENINDATKSDILLNYCVTPKEVISF